MFKFGGDKKKKGKSKDDFLVDKKPKKQDTRRARSLSPKKKPGKLEKHPEIKIFNEDETKNFKPKNETTIKVKRPDGTIKKIKYKRKPKTKKSEADDFKTDESPKKIANTESELSKQASDFKTDSFASKPKKTKKKKQKVPNTDSEISKQLSLRTDSNLKTDDDYLIDSGKKKSKIDNDVFQKTSSLKGMSVDSRKSFDSLHSKKDESSQIISSNVASSHNQTSKSGFNNSTHQFTDTALTFGTTIPTSQLTTEKIVVVPGQIDKSLPPAYLTTTSFKGPRNVKFSEINQDYDQVSEASDYWDAFDVQDEEDAILVIEKPDTHKLIEDKDAWGFSESDSEDMDDDFNKWYSVMDKTGPYKTKEQQEEFLASGRRTHDPMDFINEEDSPENLNGDVDPNKVYKISGTFKDPTSQRQHWLNIMDDLISVASDDDFVPLDNTTAEQNRAAQRGEVKIADFIKTANKGKPKIVKSNFNPYEKLRTFKLIVLIF